MDTPEFKGLDSLISVINKSNIVILAVDAKPRFFYSIGAAKVGVPDIFISGQIPINFGHSLVNEIFTELNDNGYKTGLISDMNAPPFYLLPCNVNIQEFKAEFTIQADNVYEYESTELTSVKRNIDINMGIPEFLQVVLPDKHGKFPWEMDYEHSVFPQQLFCMPSI